MTPVDEDHTLYFWFQHRNALADDEDVSRRMFEGATMAFNEDKEVLEEVHRGMKAPRTPSSISASMRARCGSTSSSSA